MKKWNSDWLSWGGFSILDNGQFSPPRTFYFLCTTMVRENTEKASHEDIGLWTHFLKAQNSESKQRQKQYCKNAKDLEVSPMLLSHEVSNNGLDHIY